MNFYINAKTMMQRFEEIGIKYHKIFLSNNWFVIVCDYGGRVLGPFAGDEADSMFWASPDFADPVAFAEKIQNRVWNIGGDRYWVNPELPFFIEDRADFFNSYVVQEALDPGHYTLEVDGNRARMTQAITLKSFARAGEFKQASMQRDIIPIANPFAGYADNGVECFAFKQVLRLEDTGDDNSLYLESWILTQMNPHGTIIMPYVGEKVDPLNYYEDIPEELIRTENGRAIVEVTGDVRYKLGFHASQITGRSGFIGELKDGRTYLLIKNFFNDPSNLYTGAPNSDETKYGYSMFIYNDPGSQGGFAEYETAATTISGDTGLKVATDEVFYYFFVGTEEQINQIASKLL